jgi:hypothetical protein
MADITTFEESSKMQISLQYLHNERVHDTWFLLLISAIVAQLGFVGDSAPRVHFNIKCA